MMAKYVCSNNIDTSCLLAGCAASEQVAIAYTAAETEAYQNVDGLDASVTRCEQAVMIIAVQILSSKALQVVSEDVLCSRALPPQKRGLCCNMCTF